MSRALSNNQMDWTGHEDRPFELICTTQDTSLSSQMNTFTDKQYSYYITFVEEHYLDQLLVSHKTATHYQLNRSNKVNPLKIS